MQEWTARNPVWGLLVPDWAPSQVAARESLLDIDSTGKFTYSRRTRISKWRNMIFHFLKDNQNKGRKPWLKIIWFSGLRVTVTHKIVLIKKNCCRNRKHIRRLQKRNRIMSTTHGTINIGEVKPKTSSD